MTGMLAALLMAVSASAPPPDRVGTGWSRSPAHEIHSTLTVARVTAGMLELRVRVFADDLSQVVARFAGQAAPSDSSVGAPELARYVAAHLGAFGPSGQRVVLESCGIERVREVYLLCYRTAHSPLPVRSLRNSLLTDLHDDQVNVVQVTAGAARRSHLLTKDAPTVALPTSR